MKKAHGMIIFDIQDPAGHGVFALLEESWWEWLMADDMPKTGNAASWEVKPPEPMADILNQIEGEEDEEVNLCTNSWQNDKARSIITCSNDPLMHANIAKKYVREIKNTKGEETFEGTDGYIKGHRTEEKAIKALKNWGKKNGYTIDPEIL